MGGLLPGKKNSFVMFSTTKPAPQTSQMGFSLEKLLKTGGSAPAKMVAGAVGVAVSLAPTTVSSVIEGETLG
jgi:hypothetical protein